MRVNTIFFLLTFSFFISCQDESTFSSGTTESVADKEKIELTGLDKEHPNKSQFEFFLNNYEEAFLPTKIDSTDFINQGSIVGPFCFITEKTDVEVMLFFADHQDHLIDFADTNAFTVGNYGVNGGGLFVAEGDDQYDVWGVLGWFAGEE